MHEVKSARPHVWLDGSGDWAWPGTGGGEAAVELLPPPWVPALPRRSEQAAGASAIPGTRRSQRGLARRYGTSLLLAALAAACAGLALDGRADIERLTGIQTVTHPSAAQISLERS